MGKIIDKIRTEHFCIGKLFCHLIEAVRKLSSDFPFSKIQPNRIIAVRKLIHGADQFIQRPQRNTPHHKGDDRSHENTRQGKLQQYKSQAVARGMRKMKNSGLDQQPGNKHNEHHGHNQNKKCDDRHKNNERKRTFWLSFPSRPSSVSTALLLHTFLTALYPSPRTETISNSSHPSNRFRSRPICTVTVSQPVSLSIPQISSMS